MAWEAQFGDFVNGAQIVIDQFLVASEVKWDQASRLVLLLPHGYEGQGPEHSSARVERFLELSAEDNICVANVTTAAQLFHLLRRQVLVPAGKPLVLFTPKRYLRAREAYSQVEELTHGAFREVIDDAVAAEEIRRVVLATGKVALDLLVARDQRGISDVAVVRVEQLYPWPKEQLAGVLSRYTDATEIVWAQEEPANMGAWDFVRDRLSEVVIGGRTLVHVARPPSGSPATGSHTLHELEQADILERALGHVVPPWSGGGGRGLALPTERPGRRGTEVMARKDAPTEGSGVAHWSAWVNVTTGPTCSARCIRGAVSWQWRVEARFSQVLPARAPNVGRSQRPRWDDKTGERCQLVT